MLGVRDVVLLYDLLGMAVEPVSRYVVEDDGETLESALKGPQVWCG